MLTHRSFLLPASILRALTAIGFVVQTRGDYTIDNVPDEIKSLPITNNILYADVLSAGAKVGTGLTSEEAVAKGFTKNHWVFRALTDVPDGDTAEQWQIQFSMDLDLTPHGSMDNLYTGSSRQGFSDTGSVMQFSDVGSNKKVPDIGGNVGNPLFPGSSGKSDGQSAVFSDAGSQLSPPKIGSSASGSVGGSVGGVIALNPGVQGAPVRGQFNIKVRNRAAPSHAAIVVFSLELRANTTFGQLFNALVVRNMFPFHFGRVGFAYMGCRHFISQAVAAFIHQGLMRRGIAHKVSGGYQGGPDTHFQAERHIYDLLSSRYSKPRIVGHLSGSDDDNNTDQYAYRETPNPIDRGVFPSNYQEVTDPLLKFQLPPGI
ncbi:hypothetical protein FRC11_006652 [Ceratobasidium sp. 423]|nr:hypothetical protein FRC11_006652 [Ceratobasidium sp. 423]